MAFSFLMFFKVLFFLVLFIFILRSRVAVRVMVITLISLGVMGFKLTVCLISFISTNWFLLYINFYF